VFWSRIWVSTTAGHRRSALDKLSDPGMIGIQSSPIQFNPIQFNPSTRDQLIQFNPP
jgi:hypothetical protein